MKRDVFAALGAPGIRITGQVRAWRTDLLLGGLVVLAVALVMVALAGLPESFPISAMLLFLLLVLAILLSAPGSFVIEGPGLANRVTLVRAALVLPVVALIFYPGHQPAAAIYAVVSLASLALVLDGVDGRVARRTGHVTAFGARFDMELDALLIMALAVLVWQTGQVGAWVLLIGLMRYGFVAAGWYWHWLQGELPPSRRRQALCVVQSVALLVALVPLAPPLAATAIAFGALALLVYSFAADVLWLHRRNRD